MEGITGAAVTITICLGLSAMFSASETALTSLNELKVKHIMQEKGDKAKNLELWLKHPNKILNTILIGNNIVNILSSVLAADLANKLLKDSAIAIVTGIMTLLILIFGEIMPKTFAKHNAEKISLFMIGFLKLFYYLFYPLSYSLNKLVKWMISIFGGNVEHIGPKITEDEIEFLITVGEKEGVLENQKKEMLHNIFEISETLVREVMVPRTDMTTIRIDMPIPEIIEIISKTEYSRIPVYEGKIDNIVGILYVKDILKHANTGIQNINIRKIIKKTYFVPATKRIDFLLQEFQLNRMHLAIVVDEYGDVDGLITLEDILEEIVGEIRDEYDKEEDEEIHKIDENEYIVDGRINIDDFCEKFSIEKTSEMDEYETISGLIYDLAGKIPDIGDEYIVGEYKLIVNVKEGRKLRKIKVIRTDNNTEESKDDA